MHNYLDLKLEEDYRFDLAEGRDTTSTERQEVQSFKDISKKIEDKAKDLEEEGSSSTIQSVLDNATNWTTGLEATYCYQMHIQERVEDDWKALQDLCNKHLISAKR